MNALMLAAVLFAARPTTEIVQQCSASTISPSEVWANVGDVIPFSAQTISPGNCGMTIETTTPSLVAIENARSDQSGATANVRALALGDATIITTRTRNTSTAIVHIISCASGANAINLAPVYTSQVHNAITIVPGITGALRGNIGWFVDGHFYASGPSMTITPAETGVMQIVARSDSRCDQIIEAKSFLIVGPMKTRAVRRR